VTGDASIPRKNKAARVAARSSTVLGYQFLNSNKGDFGGDGCDTVVEAGETVAG
jgi:hypothetical protein